MRPAHLRLAVAVALVAAGAAACSKSSPPPNVLLVVVDTLRADHLGSYGYARPTSPHLDALAARGVRFSQAHATSSWTAPSVASILTGLYPAVHGVETAASVLGPKVPTMAEAFRAAGYATGAISANPVFVSPRVGFERGFQSFDVLRGPPVSADRPVKMIPVDNTMLSFVEVATADKVTDAALAWIARQAGKPWFLYVHYIDPHADYFPPADYASRFGVAPDAKLAGVAQRPLLRTFRPPASAEDLATLIGLYDGEIAFTDAQLGRLFDVVEAAPHPTLIVATADHGEELGDHGRMLHTMTLFEEVLRVPLVVSGAGLPARVVDAPISLAALWPTIAELGGVPSSAPSASFASLARGDSDRVATVFADLAEVVSAIPHVHKHAAIDGSWKLLAPVEGPELLFDLGRDPGERADVASTNSAEAVMLRGVLATRAIAATRSRESAAAETVELSPEDRARMRALGYGN